MLELLDNEVVVMDVTMEEDDIKVMVFFLSQCRPLFLLAIDIPNHKVVLLTQMQMCQYTPSNPFVSQDPNMVICQICNKAGHTTTTCYQRGNFAYNAQYYPGSPGHLGNGGGLLNENSSPMVLVSFVLDSGATNHMTSNPDVLQQHSPYLGQSHQEDNSFWQ